MFSEIDLFDLWKSQRVQDFDLMKFEVRQLAGHHVVDRLAPSLRSRLKQQVMGAGWEIDLLPQRLGCCPTVNSIAVDLWSMLRHCRLVFLRDGVLLSATRYLSFVYSSRPGTAMSYRCMDDLMR